MPWTTADVSRFKSGLTARQKRQWVRIANSVLKKCKDEGRSNCEASAIRQANGVVGNEVNINDMKNAVEKFIILVNEEHGEPIEDWEYLIHHIEVIDEEEELHHCFVLDHLGNKYETGHVIDEEGKLRHCILGLVEEQDVYWSDQEAVEAGETVPCPGRQLEE